MSSLVEYPKVNMHKEVKIEFIGDKVNDAGGLLREWIHMVVKEIYDQETGILTVANTDEIMYKLKWDEELDDEFSVDLFKLFGVILGKAVF
jgi:E3 ubiquitin-protein ligase HUWE1